MPATSPATSIDVRALADAATRAIASHADELTALDQAIGDGDHGANMRRGAEAVRARLDEIAGQSLPDAARTVGTTLVGTVGGASGPIFGTAFLALGKALPEAPTRADVAGALSEAIEAVERRGKARRGQKTLLDVLHPVRDAVADGADPARVAEVAHEAMRATGGLAAQKGRASFLGDRAEGHVDPGSRSAQLVIAALCGALDQGAPR